MRKKIAEVVGEMASYVVRLDTAATPSKATAYGCPMDERAHTAKPSSSIKPSTGPQPPQHPPTAVQLKKALNEIPEEINSSTTDHDGDIAVDDQNVDTEAPIALIAGKWLPSVLFCEHAFHIPC